ncbi:D-2-hydroxyacid dehydrogenase [Suttonella sp. R2A3]|uniref:D-2-hydroxyacid dehydrogenase n=1 Tax=Suttonella sp. R2A3 TaxID=2908648 RepID=UPI001F1676F6|nr:D-2-hydroxyacid dehydrogenase [Suttonella sp. R2A3]UJF24488.1 D-2-hydroxyacid dehydrogenase [Suttonella sp. R2A3]
MRAVFLDAATFSPEVSLIPPDGVSDWQSYGATEQDEALIIERLQDAEIAVINKVVITASIIDQLPKLKMIQVTATGVDNVDAKACATKNIEISNVAGYAQGSVPEHTFMLMLSAMRALRYYNDAVNTGRWREEGGFCLNDVALYDLQGKTLGIIGAGEIGRRVAGIARAFAMTVLLAERPGCAPRNAQYSAFDEVLARSDVLSLHCPLNEETKGLINAQTIGKMQRKPLVINLARGGVVDSQAVVEALENKQLFGYASDVFSQEPPSEDEPLLAIADHPRVVFTPHNAWAGLGAQTRLWEMLREQVTQFIHSYQP